MISGSGSGYCSVDSKVHPQFKTPAGLFLYKRLIEKSLFPITSSFLINPSPIKSSAEKVSWSNNTTFNYESPAKLKIKVLSFSHTGFFPDDFLVL